MYRCKYACSQSVDREASASQMLIWGYLIHLKQCKQDYLPTFTFVFYSISYCHLTSMWESFLSKFQPHNVFEFSWKHSRCVIPTCLTLVFIIPFLASWETPNVFELFLEVSVIINIEENNCIKRNPSKIYGWFCQDLSPVTYCMISMEPALPFLTGSDFLGKSSIATL